MKIKPDRTRTDQTRPCLSGIPKLVEQTQNYCFTSRMGMYSTVLFEPAQVVDVLYTVAYFSFYFSALWKNLLRKV